MSISRLLNSIRHFDLPFVAAVASLLVIGSIVVNAALPTTGSGLSLWWRFIAAMNIGLIIAVLISFIPHNFFTELSLPIYILSVFLLVLVLVFGVVIHGSKSWFALGPIHFQPSELAKLATILYVSKLVAFYWERDVVLVSKAKLHVILALAFPLFLIMLEPDVSSSISFVFLALLYVFCADILRPGLLAMAVTFFVLLFAFLLLHCISGLSLSEVSSIAGILQNIGFGPGAGLMTWFFLFIVLGIGSWIVYRMGMGILIMNPRTTWLWAAGLWFFIGSAFLLAWGGWKALKGYQVGRIVSFLFPGADPLGSGYNIAQSKIAIGAGGFLGRGQFLSTQTSLGFLPAKHTDFAFSTLAETMGFMGSIVVIALFVILLWRLGKFAELARDDFARLVSLGFLGLWTGEVFLNLACVLGLFPILGLGLPFVSYGGSRLVVNLIGVGILLSISRGIYVYR
ncbi:FtsW/RodA/SpoVE family cell cycle protein [Elusimicrobiota bacterium]